MQFTSNVVFYGCCIRRRCAGALGDAAQALGGPAGLTDADRRAVGHGAEAMVPAVHLLTDRAGVGDADTLFVANQVRVAAAVAVAGPAQDSGPHLRGALQAGGERKTKRENDVQPKCAHGPSLILLFDDPGIVSLQGGEVYIGWNPREGCAGFKGAGTSVGGVLGQGEGVACQRSVV